MPEFASSMLYARQNGQTPGIETVYQMTKMKMTFQILLHFCFVARLPPFPLLFLLPLPPLPQVIIFLMLRSHSRLPPSLLVLQTLASLLLQFLSLLTPFESPLLLIWVHIATICLMRLIFKGSLLHLLTPPL